ncbi:hypothetical protein IWZ03DRAFT_175906 [Phyllosticta citriasiana]|uniref:Secreted protein n=1 Tax=Phyllosticta citriasiana TaxID=595635 RepID=A0ABR1KQF8_9PEZI
MSVILHVCLSVSLLPYPTVSHAHGEQGPRSGRQAGRQGESEKDKEKKLNRTTHPHGVPHSSARGERCWGTREPDRQTNDHDVTDGEKRHKNKTMHTCMREENSHCMQSPGSARWIDTCWLPCLGVKADTWEW